MIDPQVEHGGASSWFCIAAKAARPGAGLATDAPVPAPWSGSVACVTASGIPS